MLPSKIKIIIIMTVNALSSYNIYVSIFQTLHHTNPNPTHLYSFGCLCFPWLHPYASNKLQPKYQPCIFVGYATSQYGYLCLEPKTQKIYTSRHDHIFPYYTLTQKFPTQILTSITNQPLHITIPLTPTHNPLHTQPTIRPHQLQDAPLCSNASGNSSNHSP